MSLAKVRATRYPGRVHTPQLFYGGFLMCEQQPHQGLPFEIYHKSSSQQTQDAHQDSYSQALVICLPDGATICASSKAKLVTEGRCPVGFTVAILPIVTHPSAMALHHTLVNPENTDILTLTIEADFSFSTLCSRKHKPWVWHVIAQIHMGPPAQNPTSFLLWDVCFYGNCIGTNDWPAGTTLTLDFSALGISHLTFDEGALGVFATVAIRVSCRVDSLKADARGWFRTWSPERDTLLLMGLADAVVAVTVHSLTRVPIM